MKEQLQAVGRVRPAAVAVCCLLLPLSGGRADGVAQSDARRLLDEVRRLLGRHYPEAKVLGSGDAVRFELRTRKFLIHEQLLTGEWQDAREEVGPQPGGVWGDLELRPGKYAGMAVVPQSFDKRYFTLLVLAPYSAERDRHLYARLKYPRDAPAEFLKGFETVVNGFAKRAPSGAREGTPPALPPPGSASLVAENSQATLRAVVGAEEWEWANPAGLLPERFPGLQYVSGPDDKDLPPKAAWRKPLVMRDERARIDVSVNCYCKRLPARAAPEDRPPEASTPASPLMEPDYEYRSVAFHGLKAAAAGWDEGSSRREVLAFVMGDHLFKVRCEGPASADRLRRQARSVADTIRSFRINR